MKRNISVLKSRSSFRFNVDRTIKDRTRWQKECPKVSIITPRLWTDISDFFGLTRRVDGTYHVCSPVKVPVGRPVHCFHGHPGDKRAPERTSEDRDDFRTLHEPNRGGAPATEVVSELEPQT